MSAYYQRYCAEHGEYDADVDGDQECEQCVAEGKTPMQKMGRDLTALRERVKVLEAAIKNLRDVKGRYHTEQATTALFKLLKEPTHG